MLCIVKKTLNTIVATNNHYVVAIKRNRHKLYSLIESATVKLSSSIGYYKKKENNRGRKEIRIIHVFNSSKEIVEYLPHIKVLVRVKRIRQNKQKTTEDITYYASDVNYSAKNFYKGIRDHWSIENRLHWVKDVVMLEDKSKYSNMNSASIISILKSLVVLIGYLYSDSISNFQRSIAYDVESMRFLLE